MKLKIDTKEIVKIIEELKGDLSWRQVAKRCHLGHAVICNLKNGKYNPGLKTLMKLTLLVPIDKRNDLYNRFLDYVEWI